jgi:hypothetical protein
MASFIRLPIARVQEEAKEVRTARHKAQKPMMPFAPLASDPGS